MTESSQKLTRYLSDKKALIVSNNSEARSTIRLLLKQLGMITGDIYVETSLEKSIATLKEKMPQIIFISYKIDDSSGLSLLSQHHTMHPNRLQSSFFILSNHTSSILDSLIQEGEIDNYCIEPFVMKDLIDKTESVFNAKINPSKEEKSLYEGKFHYLNNEFDKALDLFTNLIESVESPIQELCWQGKTYIALKKFNDAANSLNKALDIDSKDYEALSLLTYTLERKGELEEAYKKLNELTANYPINPMKLPQYIEITITNKEHEKILEYAELYKNLHEDEQTEKINIILFETMIEIGRYFYDTKNEEKGKIAFDYASHFSQNKEHNIEKIAHEYINLQLWEECSKFLKEKSSYIEDSTTTEIFNCQLDLAKGKYGEVLTKITPFIENNIKDFRIYEIAINASVLLERTEEQIDDIIVVAEKAYPELEVYFRMLPEQYMSNSPNKKKKAKNIEDTEGFDKKAANG